VLPVDEIVGWLRPLESQNRQKANIEIVGWLPQLSSRTFDTNSIRMINNSYECLLNQIMRATTPKQLPLVDFDATLIGL